MPLLPQSKPVLSRVRIAFLKCNSSCFPETSIFLVEGIISESKAQRNLLMLVSPVMVSLLSGLIFIVLLLVPFWANPIIVNNNKSGKNSLVFMAVVIIILKNQLFFAKRIQLVWYIIYCIICSKPACKSIFKGVLKIVIKKWENIMSSHFCDFSINFPEED